MKFNQNNRIIQLCMQGMHIEATGNPEQAVQLFRQAWDEAANDFEKFIASFCLARQQNKPSNKLKWFKTALEFALHIDDATVKSAYPYLYNHISECYVELGYLEQAKKQQELALATAHEPTDNGPFYHGTRADLKVGDRLIAGRLSNYQAELIMNHIYFTAMLNGAGLAAALARGDGPERVYIVEPTGSFEDDPNVTNKKFPGNLTRSYRTKEPVKIIGEATEWQRLTPEELQQWRQKLAENKGEIIN